MTYQEDQVYKLVNLLIETYTVDDLKNFVFDRLSEELMNRSVYEINKDIRKLRGIEDE